MSRSDNTMVTKRKRQGDKERENGKDRGWLMSRGMKSSDYRANRVTLVVNRLSAHLYELLLPVYVLFTLLTVPRLSTYRHSSELSELFEVFYEIIASVSFSVNTLPVTCIT